jgi:hypothetical protein
MAVMKRLAVLVTLISSASGLAHGANNSRASLSLARTAAETGKPAQNSRGLALPMGNQVRVIYRPGGLRKHKGASVRSYDIQSDGTLVRTKTLTSRANGDTEIEAGGVREILKRR